MSCWKLAIQGLFIFALTALGGVNYTYDAAGRLTTVNYGNGSVITYTYDQAGNLIGRAVGTGPGNGGSCTYMLSLGGQAFGATGGGGVVNVATDSGCAWSTSGAASWVTFSNGSGNGNGSASFTVAANNGGDRAASVTIAGQSFTIEQEAASISGLSLIGSMAHLAAEENWITNFTLVNKSGVAAQARLSLFGDALDPSGIGPLALPLVFPQSAATAPLLASSFDRTINPNASLIVTSAGSQTPPVLQGSAQLAATGVVDGFAIFHLIPGAQEAVVPMETRNASSYILAFDNTNGVVLGVAVANLSAQTAVIPVVIRDDSGAVISAAGASISLGGNSHTAFVLSDPAHGFPVTANLRGTIEFDTPSGGQVSVLGIRTTPMGATNTLTTIPALANVGTSGGSIAHIATGNGWQTTFVLVNTGTTASQAHLKFFADAGSPLSLPLTFPQGGAAETASSVDRTLAPGAMLLVQSAAPLSDPTPTVGSAQVTTDGNVGGFVIFRLNTNGQEAVVPLESRRANAYILAFDNTGDIATGVALNSIAAQAINVPVIVRDAAGAQIATDTLSLPANGHSSFTLVTDKYPATAHIRGTIEFDPPVSGEIGALGIRIPAAAHTFTTLPALAK